MLEVVDEEMDDVHIDSCLIDCDRLDSRLKNGSPLIYGDAMAIGHGLPYSKYGTILE